MAFMELKLNDVSECFAGTSRYTVKAALHNEGLLMSMSVSKGVPTVHTHPEISPNVTLSFGSGNASGRKGLGAPKLIRNEPVALPGSDARKFRGVTRCPIRNHNRPAMAQVMTSSASPRLVAGQRVSAPRRTTAKVSRLCDTICSKSSSLDPNRQIQRVL